MKQRHRGVKEPARPDPDFAEALNESQSLGRQAERKTRQFCRQVQRALNLALADRDVFVEEVVPAPDCGRLLVFVALPADAGAESIVTLGRETPRLRAEVAAAITRKRAPELCFVPACGEGGGYE